MGRHPAWEAILPILAEGSGVREKLNAKGLQH